VSEDFSSFAARLGELRKRAVSPQRAEMRRLADAMRLVVDRLVATRAPADELERAASALEDVAAALEGFPRGHTFEGFAESANSGDPHAFFDHSPMIGLANPLAPPLQLAVEGGRVLGAVRFGAAYEGPPGCVHGGFIAAAFDEVLGMAQSMGGRPGMTGTLTVRYRRPTPLHAELRFDAGLDRVEGRKNFTSGRLLHGDEVTAEAEAIFVTVDFAKIAQLYGRSQP
jgi:acyl-coenzyme A thioesterase PaaI-like protein